MSLFIETSLRRAKILREWRTWVQCIAKTAKELIPSSIEVYVIGSIVRGDYVARSDVDIPIISPNIPNKVSDRAKVKVLI